MNTLIQKSETKTTEEEKRERNTFKTHFDAFKGCPFLFILIIKI